MILPGNPSDEIGVIGCMLAGGLETAADATESIRGEMFVDTDCATAFGILSEMVNQGNEINILTFHGEWRKRFGERPMPERIQTSPDQVPSAANLTYYGDALRDDYRRRRIILGMDRVMQLAGDPTQSIDSILAEAEPLFFGHEAKTTQNLDGKAFAHGLLGDLEARHERQGQLTGIATGFSQLDSLTEGLQPGELFVIGARPSAGKTAIAANIVSRACLEDHVPTLFVTLEMSPTAIGRRMLSGCMRIPLATIKSGRFTEADFAKISSFNTTIGKAPIHFHDAVSGIDCATLGAVIRRHVRKYRVKLVVVDYLQKVTACKRQEKRTYEVGEVSGALKAAAASNDVALLALAQLSREPDKDRGRLPRLADLADSAQVERDADVVALLHRPRTKENTQGTEALLIIAKARDGELGNVPLYFDGTHCRFSVLAPDEPEEAST